MRFMNFSRSGRRGLAVSADHAGAFFGVMEDEAAFPGSLDTLLAQGDARLERAAAALMTGERIDLTEVTYLPPVERAGKIVCVGLNYADHAAEAGHKPPTYPTIFSRFNSSLIGHGAAIIRPRVSACLDFEGEIAAILGRGGRDIPRERALEHVAGYALFNDASVRDYQVRTPQWTIGKNFDGTGAFGPWFVTADSLPPGCTGLELQTRLNGEVMQQASTTDLIFDVATLIALLSEVFTFAPGDVIVTGTPSGIGAARKPPLFMKPGDVCEIRMEGLGILRNPVLMQTED